MLNTGWWPVLWFLAKLWVFLFVFIWLRGTLLRLRYDQFMKLGWKVLIPVALVWVVAASPHARAAVDDGDLTRSALRLAGGAGRPRRRAARPLRDEAPRGRAEAPDSRPPTTIDPFAGGYPVPPLPGQPLRDRRRVRRWPPPTPRPRAAPAGGRRAEHATSEEVRVADARPTSAGRRRAPRDPDLFAGFGVTFSTMFRQVVTEEYPEVKVPTAAALPRPAPAQPAPRRPGEVHRLRAVRVGLPRRRDLRRGRGQHRGASGTRPGERYGRVYQINYLRCIFCGLCIEACPTRALTMTNEYELAGPSRAGLIYEKQDLLARCCPACSQAPHPMVAGHDRERLLPRPGHRGHARAARWVEARRGEDAADGDAPGATGRPGARELAR